MIGELVYLYWIFVFVFDFFLGSRDIRMRDWVVLFFVLNVGVCVFVIMIILRFDFLGFWFIVGFGVFWV